MSVCLQICLSVCLSVCLFDYQPVCLSVCLTICLSVCRCFSVSVSLLACMLILRTWVSQAFFQTFFYTSTVYDIVFPPACCYHCVCPSPRPPPHTRMSPFCLKNFFAYKRNKANLDPFHMCFTIKFHFSFFASNFSLRFTWVIFASKRNKVNRNSSLFFCFFFAFFTFFRYFSHFFTFFSFFFAFFRFFRFKFFTSLQFSYFCFEAKQSEAKFKWFCSLFSLFFGFLLFFAFFYFFSHNFHFASIFSLNFHLFYLRFRFRFLLFRIEVYHVKSGFFSLRSETKFSLQFQISLPKRK